MLQVGAKHQCITVDDLMLCAWHTNQACIHASSVELSDESILLFFRYKAFVVSLEQKNGDLDLAVSAVLQVPV